ncbi:MAG: putative Ig domain-containing protein, partial [Bacillota bacterium]
MTRKVFIFLILLVFTASANMLSTSGETFAEDMLSFSSLEPAPVSTSISDYSTVSGGGTHSVFLKSDGTVWSWGNNWRGQLGDGTVKNKNKRVQVSGVKGIKAISAGAEHTVALKDDGTVWTWGNNNSGQLGDSSTQNRYSPVQGLYLTGAKGIAAGGLHSVALKEDGTVWVWGDNYYGQLGTGNTMNSIIPVMIADTNNVKDVAAGFSHTILLKDDGTVWACGYNDYGQLGDGTNLHSSTPVQVKGLSGVKAIAAGGYHSMALKEDGTVWVWGSSVNGQAGDGSTGIRLIPAQVSGISIVNAIAAGGYHSMALKEDGTVWAWGSNSHGQIGDGVSGSKLIPVQVKGLSNVKAISGGDYHSAVLKNDKTVWTWGWNSYGQLGDGTNTNKNIPVQTEETLNNPPSIGFIGDKTVDEGSLLEFGINAIDLDGDSLTYSVPILPYGAAFDPVLRIFSWIPDYTQAGVYFVSFEVKDALTSSILTIMITVNNVNQPPKANAGEEITVEATSSKGAQVILNGSYSFDPDGDDLVYFWEGPFGIIQEAAPTVTVPLGVNRIMLTVSDGELTNTSEVIIKVVDTKPPEVTIEGIADGFDYTDSVIPQILINDFESGI